VKQMTDDPATEKPGSTENRDEPAMAGYVVCKVFCHDAPACLARFGLSSQGGCTSACCGVPPCQRAARSPEGWVSSSSRSFTRTLVGASGMIFAVTPANYTILAERRFLMQAGVR